jgi:hypothetical protein
VTRSELIESEVLIDLCEWSRLHGFESPFPVPSAITARLWAEIERIPFRLTGLVSFEERVQHVIAKARACLEWQLQTLETRDDMNGIVAAFSATLPSGACDRARRKLHVFCGRCDGADIVITVGLPEELPLPGCGDDALVNRCAGRVEATRHPM